MNLHTLGRSARGGVASSHGNLAYEQATFRWQPESKFRSNLNGYGHGKAFSQVSARGKLAIIYGSTRRAVLRVRNLGRSEYALCRRMFRPNALGLCGLVIAVALWSFGYKLSVYQRHPTSAQQASKAKLWIDAPDASQVAVQRLKNQSHLVASPQALCHTVSWLPRLGRAAASTFLVPMAGVQSFDLPILPRSPPSQQFRSL